MIFPLNTMYNHGMGDSLKRYLVTNHISALWGYYARPFYVRASISTSALRFLVRLRASYRPNVGRKEREWYVLRKNLGSTGRTSHPRAVGYSQPINTFESLVDTWWVH